MSLYRAIATVGGWTLASRVLGFIRDILIARLLGVGPVADAFFVAFRFPNLFRRLFAEGAFNSSFVPLFARKAEEQGQPAAIVFAEQVLAVLLTTLLALTIAAQLSMPWLIYAIAPGFAADPAKIELTARLTVITFPYLMFMSLIALQSGILNSLHRFARAAATPMLFNVVAILALLLVLPLTGAPGDVLAWSVAVAGVVQFLWLVHACARAQVVLRLPWPRLTPDVRRLLKLMLPGIVATGVIQLNLVIGTIIASLQAGAVSYLYYADRVYQLPLSVIGAAVGVVLLPELTRHIRAGRPEAALDSHNRGIELTLLLSLPAAVGLVVLADPIVRVLYERGAFDAQARGAVAAALAAFACGLPAYVLIKALTPGFFAREDTTTPFRFAMADVGTNIVLSLTLFPLLGFLGIAIATATAAWVNVGLLAWRLHRRALLRLDARLRRRLWRVPAASALMGLGLWLAAHGLGWALAGSLLAKAVALGVLVLGGLVLYGLLALALGAFSWGEIRRRFAS
jgi:putative peptidoglycan lipid II flippase